MTWGSFSTTHLITLALAVLINILIYLILRKKSRSMQIVSLFAISLIGIAFLVSNIIVNQSDWFKYLPLSFWALNTVLLPFAIITRGKRICNLLLIWSTSSMIALVFNSSMSNVNIFTGEFIIYFVMHMFGAGIPILLFELGLVKRDTKTIKSTLIATLGAYTIVHLVNLAINSANGWSVNQGVNYMNTLAPNSSLLYFFYAFIPSAYWYMILSLPLLLVYLVYWYLPEILDQRRQGKPLKEKLNDIDAYYDEYEEEYIDEIIDEKYDW